MRKLMLWSRDHPWMVISALLLLSVFSAYHAKNLVIDSSTKGLMIEDDPARLLYDRALTTFGSDNITIVYIKDQNLFSHEVLTAIEDVFYNLQDISGVSRVDGLFNATNFKGEEGFLNTNLLLDWVPEDSSELAQIKADALRSPLLNKTLISPVGTGMAISVTADPDCNDPDFNIRLANEIEKVIQPLQGKVNQVFQMGAPETSRFLRDSIQEDQRTVGPLFLILLLVLLIVGIRTVNGAFLPVLTGGLSVLWTVGYMTILGIPFNFLTAIIPSLVLIIGATEDMHMLSEYLHGLESGKDRMRAIEYMAEKTGLAVLLTGLTTFLGFLTIVVNEITILKQFGKASAFALFINPLITATLVPVYLRFFGETKRRERVKEGRTIYERIAHSILYFVHRRQKLLLAGMGVATFLVGWGIFSIRMDADIIGYFKEGSDIRVRSNQLHEELSGMQNFYIILDAKQEGGFKKSENLKKLFEIQKFIEQHKKFDASLSVANHLALINREMSDGKPEHYIIPERDDLISQYLLFFTRSDLERYVSADYSQANIHVRHNLSSSYELKETLSELNSFITAMIGETSSFYFTGESILYNNAADTMARGQIYSLSLILIFIFVIMSILFVRVKAGLLSLVPNAIPILFLFGIMGLTGVPLNPGTAMIAACAIGIAVDDTIHLFVRYNNEMKRFNNQRLAVIETIQGDLRPVLITTIGLAFGFAILGLSNFIPTIQFGLLSAMVMVFALFADLLITPSLLMRTKLITIWDLLGMHLTENVVKRSELFKDMRPWQIKRVVLLGHIKEIAANDYIIRQGKMDRTMYMILEGGAKMEISTKKGERVKLRELTEAEVFGVIALVNGVATTANVISTQETKVLSFDWEALVRIGKIFPRISTRFFLNISRILGSRLAVDTAKLAER